MLEAKDGNRFDAFSAVSEDPDAPGRMIVHDVRGLHPFYEELAVRFAEAGVHATAIDLFGRTAGTGPRPEDFDHRAHVARLTPDYGGPQGRGPDDDTSPGAPHSFFDRGFERFADACDDA